jgi:hypothetical protein
MGFLSSAAKVCKYLTVSSPDQQISNHLQLGPALIGVCIGGIISKLLFENTSYYKCKKTNPSCASPIINTRSDISYTNIFGKKCMNSYCGYCYTFNEILNIFKNFSVNSISLNNMPIKELTNENLPNIKALIIRRCNLLESIHDIPSLVELEMTECPMLKKVYNVPNIEKQCITAHKCNLLTLLPYYDNQYRISTVTKTNNEELISNMLDMPDYFTCINECNWLDFNNIKSEIFVDAPFYIPMRYWMPDISLEARINKLIKIQHLYKWRHIKKILYKKTSKSVVDFIIRKFYI